MSIESDRRMKPHIKIRLKERLPVDPPHWLDVMKDPDLSHAKFHPKVTPLLEGRKILYITTSEYQPRGSVWSPAEIDAGLNRVYRLVLKENSSVPSDLIEQISLIPIVDEVNAGVVGHVELPPVRVAQMSVSTDSDSRNAI